MRIIETKAFLFTELSEEAQRKAVEEYYHLPTSEDWWDNVYYDALTTAGLQINAFDIDRASYVNGEWDKDANYSMRLIIENHRVDTDTYKTAREFEDDWSTLVRKYSEDGCGDIVAEGNEYEFDQEADELEKDFLYNLCECYRIILTKEYEYLTSDKNIRDFLTINEYEFTEEGKLI